MRLRRMLAVAERDLRVELGGRRGWFLPLLAAGLLLPAATAPPIPDKPVEMGPIRVAGDVPPALLDLDRIQLDEERALLHFVAPTAEEPALRVRGDMIAATVHEKLDELYPGKGIRTEVIARPVYLLPDRSLLLSLLSASLLTGAISQSLPGERSNRTLETLLTASITREELVAGKWLAWGGFGALFGTAAIALAVLLGRQEAGWWMLPSPTVALGTVALGFWLVRRTADVVGGATVAIRVLPAVLFGLGAAAWVLGTTHPLLGAALPLGGALMTAGALWDGPLPALVATTSTLLASFFLLRQTARDLDPEERTADTAAVDTLATVFGGAAAWCGALFGPVIWAAGGTSGLLEAIPVGHGVLAGATAIGLLTLVRAARANRPLTALGLVPPKGVAVWGAALIGMIVLAAADSWLTAHTPSEDLVGLGRTRVIAAMQPTAAPLWIAVFGVTVQELLLRGWLLRAAGPFAAIAGGVIVVGAFNPLAAVAVAWLSTELARLGDSVWPAIATRIGAVVLVAVWHPPPVNPLHAGLALALVGATFTVLRARQSAPVPA